jgi:hypothetical protein
MKRAVALVHLIYLLVRYLIYPKYLTALGNPSRSHRRTADPLKVEAQRGFYRDAQVSP